uniref:uncharacterized protein LOC131135073 isoform X2 n=1 Tax=Doryrhamphus excisus TaxID=161450 RepID=UPI0025AE8DA1|nr:uncharacterized protein LOC131135073 isoform X2 [Doryrhamphus excisus]
MCVYVCVCVDMTRATVAKLLILMILIVIICLPEFFTLNRVSKVTLACLPHVLCEQDSRRRKRENRRSGDDEVRRKRPCHPAHFTVDEKWCKDRDDDGNPTSEPRSVEDTHTRWYMCETQGNVAQLQRNNSHSAIFIEMSVELQLGDTKFLNLTLYGHSNTTELHLHSPEDDELERRDGEGHRVASYCCPPVPTTSAMSSHITCFLRLSNHTISITRAKETFPEEKSKVRPLGYGFNGRQMKDGQKDTEINILNGRNLHSYESCPMRSGLSTIEEVQADEDVVESVPNGNVDQYGTANLHHRPTVCFPHRGAELQLDRSQLQ